MLTRSAETEYAIVERVSDGKPFGKEFYLPHRPVIREGVESTKVRIVFHASVKENDQSPSLNNITELGPPLLNIGMRVAWW